MVVGSAPAQTCGLSNQEQRYVSKTWDGFAPLQLSAPLSNTHAAGQEVGQGSDMVPELAPPS